MDLLAEELHYWMPMRRNIKFGDWDLDFTSAETEINWFDEGKDVLAGRMRQINTGIHWPEEPVSRVEHIVTNVEIVGVESDEIRVNSKFFCYQNRLQDEVNHFVVRREDLLRRRQALRDFPIAVQARVADMSPATVDRALKPLREQTKARRGISTTKAGTLLKRARSRFAHLRTGRTHGPGSSRWTWWRIVAGVGPVSSSTR